MSQPIPDSLHEKPKGDVKEKAAVLTPPNEGVTPDLLNASTSIKSAVLDNGKMIEAKNLEIAQASSDVLGPVGYGVGGGVLGMVGGGVAALIGSMRHLVEVSKRLPEPSLNIKPGTAEYQKYVEDISKSALREFGKGESINARISRNPRGVIFGSILGGAIGGALLKAAVNNRHIAFLNLEKRGLEQSKGALSDAVGVQERAVEEIQGYKTKVAENETEIAHHSELLEREKEALTNVKATHKTEQERLTKDIERLRHERDEAVDKAAKASATSEKHDTVKHDVPKLDSHKLDVAKHDPFDAPKAKHTTPEDLFSDTKKDSIALGSFASTDAKSHAKDHAKDDFKDPFEHPKSHSKDHHKDPLKEAAKPHAKPKDGLDDLYFDEKKSKNYDDNAKHEPKEPAWRKHLDKAEKSDFAAPKKAKPAALDGESSLSF